MENEIIITGDRRKSEQARDQREIVRDEDTVKFRAESAKDVVDLKGILLRNLVWVIVTLVSVGTVLATVAYQGKDIEAQKNLIASDHDRIAKCEQVDIKLAGVDEKTLQKLESIDSGIKDLKNTVEKLDVKMNERMTKMSDRTQLQFDELKKILYKPVVSSVLDDLSVVVKK